MQKKCGACGSGRGMTRFTNESFIVSHAGVKTKVEGLSGIDASNVTKWRSTPEARGATRTRR